MSVWQNFKDADHSFEKKFFGVIISMALMIFVFFLLDKAFDNIPYVKRLFLNNGKLFLYFIGGLFLVTTVTSSLYYRTLDFFEAETQATIKASIINVIIWTFFWIVWSIFCAWLTFNNKPLTILVESIIIGLVFVPGFIAFIISRNIRRQQINDVEKDKLALGNNYYKSEPNTVCLDRKYYSGYYGLICLPVYFVSLIIGYII
jgi:hypothetical protein